MILKLFKSEVIFEIILMLQVEETNGGTSQISFWARKEVSG